MIRKPYDSGVGKRLISFCYTHNTLHVTNATKLLLSFIRSCMCFPELANGISEDDINLQVIEYQCEREGRPCTL